MGAANGKYGWLAWFDLVKPTEMSFATSHGCGIRKTLI
jgi:hypothetical protein